MASNGFNLHYVLEMFRYCQAISFLFCSHLTEALEMTGFIG